MSKEIIEKPVKSFRHIPVKMQPKGQNRIVYLLLLIWRDTRQLRQ